jgi:hypothetical protein
MLLVEGKKVSERKNPQHTERKTRNGKHVS